eukprot:TRINITY_DN39080_c0_g1_i1.p1 TRINITY_DN39080_c0_g1~~TRINITY_DN39080_c0_g1_i1.p1  ORF type:complete len:565 (-),score=69.89 TRINITY_DN39080_c0_g1_i1:63-1757(-)
MLSEGKLNSQLGIGFPSLARPPSRPCDEGADVLHAAVSAADQRGARRSRPSLGWCETRPNSRGSLTQHSRSLPSLHPAASSEPRAEKVLHPDCKSVVGSVQPSVRSRVRRSSVRNGLVWSLPIQHVVVERIVAHLVPGARETSGACFVSKSARRCTLEVLAEGSCSAAPIVCCRASWCPSERHCHVHWLGRLTSCPLQEYSDVWRYVDAYSPDTSQLTMAQAILGVVAAFFVFCGAEQVVLEPEDNGSGKLVRWYTRLGFSRDVPTLFQSTRVACTNRRSLFDSQEKHVKDDSMTAPAKLIARLAPNGWIEGLLPAAGFDVWSWLGCGIGDHWFFQVPWQWSWKALWPFGAVMKIAIVSHSSDGYNKMDVEAKLCCGDSELARAKGSVRLLQGTMRLLWLGRSHSRPAHPTVRGQLVYACGGFDAGGSTSSRSSACARTGGPAAEGADAAAATGTPLRATAAIAVFGAVAVVARWFGVKTVQLVALDDGTGKLVRYLRSFGFSEPPGDAPAVDGDQPQLVAPCRMVAARCCPMEWLEELPADGELALLRRLALQQRSAGRGAAA